MKPKKSHLTLVAVPLCLVSTALAASLQVNPDTLSEAKRYAYAPMGTVLVYTTRYQNSKPSVRRVKVEKSYPEKPHPVVEFAMREGRSSYYDYRMATDHGVHEVDNRGLGGTRGYDLSRSRGISLPIPARTGYEWKWSEPFRGQTMTGPDGKAPKIPPTQYTGKIVSDNFDVRVPAGTFKAVIVEIAADSRDYRTMTRTFWVKDIGVVKRETFDNNGKPLGVDQLMSIERPGKG